MQESGVEVWTARPQALGKESCESLAGVLGQDERDRAARLRFEPDRHAFVVSRAMRRIALGLALGADAQELRFGTGGQGEPVLLDPRAGAISFSLSRTRELVAFALCPGGPVGVDVEAVRDGVEADLLEPYMELPAPDEPLPLEDFYVRWTALEAFWKARGLGLSRTHPRIALREGAEGGLEVRYAGVEEPPTGLFAVRLPAPPTHVLSVACRRVDSVRIVELDRLAPMPAEAAAQQRAGAGEGRSALAGLPGILSS